MPKTAFVYNGNMTNYDLGRAHPLRPVRLAMTYELASEYGLFGGDSLIVEPTPARESDILSFHVPEYVKVVKQISEGKDVPNAWYFGFGNGDNPPFAGMYEASMLYTGASLTAADLVLSGKVERAFNISGGLHHARAHTASGFCVFNDAVIAINRLLETCDRVAYIDIDAHHGDGVQEAFYDTDRVLTISIHESGDYLFPGSGYVHEIGQGAGRGYSVNIPVPPATPDDVFTWAFEEIVPPLISAYKPDMIVAQLGADTHAEDPLAHLSLTSEGFTALVRRIISFGKPLVALGGGGYNTSIVPRLWTLAYAEMMETELPNEIPDTFARKYGVYHLRDSTRPAFDVVGHTTDSVRRSAEETVRTLTELILPIHNPDKRSA